MPTSARSGATSVIRLRATLALLLLLFERTALAGPMPPASAPPTAGKQQLYALVTANTDTRALADTWVKDLAKGAHAVRLADGYPVALARGDLPLPDGSTEPFFVVLGVCPKDRAGPLAASTGSTAVELRDGKAACPTVLEAGLETAFLAALTERSLGLAEELLAIPMSSDVRSRLAMAAAARCDAELVRKLLAGGAVEAGLVLERAIDCSGHAGPPNRTVDAPAAEALVDLLLAAGADANRHGDWIARALRQGRLSVAKKLVAAGADPRTAGPAVMSVAANESADISRWAISFGLDVNRGDDAFLPSPLLVAAAFERAENVALLLQAGADVSVRSRPGGLTALDLFLLWPGLAWRETASALLQARPAFRAAYLGDLEALSTLPAGQLDEHWGGWTPLAVAAVRGHDLAGLFLLQRGADLGVRVGNPSGVGGQDLLALAIDGGARQLALALIEKGVPLDRPASACCLNRQKGEIDLIRLRDPWEVTRLTPWDLAVHRPNEWRWDYQAGYQPPMLAPLPPLHRAAVAGQLDVVAALLARRVDRAAATDPSQGLTAAMLAAERGRTSVLKLLVESNADCSRADAAGFSTYAHALAGKNPGASTAAVEAACGKKAAETSAGVLISAVLHSNPGMVKRLIAAGAARHGEGKRAIQIACDLGIEEMFDALSERGIQSEKPFWGGCVHNAD